MLGVQQLRGGDQGWPNGLEQHKGAACVLLVDGGAARIFLEDGLSGVRPYGTIPWLGRKGGSDTIALESHFNGSKERQRASRQLFHVCDNNCTRIGCRICVHWQC